MFTRKVFALAGLVLAVAVLSPASALANAGGTDRPYRATGSGIAVSTAVSPGNLVTRFAGHIRGTHVGNATFVNDPQFITITGLGSLSYSAPNSVLTAANGDKLYTSQTGTGTFTPECIGTGDGCVITIEHTNIITGGTGRFEDASGTTHTTARTVRTSTDGTTSTSSTEFTVVGTISY